MYDLNGLTNRKELVRMIEKLNLIGLSDYLNQYGNGFYQSSRYKIKQDSKEYRGTLFKLCKPITREQKEFLYVNYANVEFFSVKSEYAPEQQTGAIFLADKAMRGEHPDKVGHVINIDSFEAVYQAFSCGILKFKHFVQKTGKYKGYHVCELYCSFSNAKHDRHLVGRVIVPKMRDDIEPLCLSTLIQYIAYKTENEFIYNKGFMAENGVIYDLSKDIFDTKSLLPNVRTFSKVQELLQTMGYSFRYIGDGEYSLCKIPNERYVCKQNVCPNYESCMLKNRNRKWGTS